MKCVSIGEIMLRLSTFGNQRFSQAVGFEACYGGGEANVAASLAILGHDSSYVTKLPDNPIGRAAEAYLRKSDVNTKHIVYGGNRLGIYYLEKGASMRNSKVVYDRADSAMANALVEEFDYNAVLDNVDWLHTSGITAGISTNGADITKRFVKEAHKRGIKVSFDVNFRSKLWSIEEARKVIPEIMQYVDVCFAGPMDAQKILGCTGKDDKELFENMAKCYGIRYIICSHRQNISASDNVYCASIYDSEKNRFMDSKCYDIRIVDRVGGGDALAAGVISELMQDYENPQYAIEFGTAASAFKHTIEGDINLAERSEVIELMNKRENMDIVR